MDDAASDQSQPANWPSRLGILAIDALVAFALWALVTNIGSDYLAAILDVPATLNSDGTADWDPSELNWTMVVAWIATWTAILIVYETLATAIAGGTLGKIAVGTRVHTRGRPPLVLRSAWRTLLKVALYWLPVLGFFTLLASAILIAVRRDRRALHDLLSGTSVDVTPRATSHRVVALLAALLLVVAGGVAAISFNAYWIADSPGTTLAAAEYREMMRRHASKAKKELPPLVHRCDKGGTKVDCTEASASMAQLFTDWRSDMDEATYPKRYEDAHFATREALAKLIRGNQLRIQSLSAAPVSEEERDRVFSESRFLLMQGGDELDEALASYPTDFRLLGT